jgi:hypothetical protein
MGSNGEAVSLTEIEKLELLRKVREMARPWTKIIAGLGLNSKCIFFRNKERLDIVWIENAL